MPRPSATKPQRSRIGYPWHWRTHPDGYCCQRNFASAERLATRAEETRERPAPIPEVQAEGTVPVPAHVRPPLDDERPIAWLLRRRRGLSAILWAGALVSLGYHGLMMIVFRLIRATSVNAVVYPLGLATMVLEGALLPGERVASSLRRGARASFELLLTSPAGATQVVSAQWEVLKRLLRWLILVLMAPILLQTATLFASSRSGFPAGFRLQYGVVELLACVDIFFSVGAICWLGMWFGLRAGGQGRAIFWTVGLVKGVPYLFNMLIWAVLGGLVFSSARGGSSQFWWRSLVPEILNLVYYLYLIRLARRHLQGEPRVSEPLRFDLWPSVLSTGRDAVRAWRKARHWTPS